MDVKDRRAALLLLVDNLREAGSWAGRTHIQKSVYLLKELHGVDLGYDFTLYKHGPYSFELDAEIEALRLVEGLSYEITSSGYGPRYAVGQAGRSLITASDLPPGHIAALKEVAQTVRALDVHWLECVSTVVWCGGARADGPSQDELAERVQGMKPHLSRNDIVAAWALLSRFRTAH